MFIRTSLHWDAYAHKTCPQSKDSHRHAYRRAVLEELQERTVHRAIQKQEVSENGLEEEIRVFPDHAIVALPFLGLFLERRQLGIS